MQAVVRSPTSLVWLALMLATAVSWWLGAHHGVGVEEATIAVLTVAFVKVRFVGMYFMELRHAPLALRLLFEGWVVVVWAGLIVLYQTGG